MGKAYVNSREIKGVVLGGGRSTRLAPLTETTSKQLLPVGDKPMISRVINQLSSAEIRDVCLLIDQRHASQYLDTLRDGSELGLRSLSYVWQDPEGKGLPTTISKVHHHIGDSKLIVACGDVLFDDSLEKPIEHFLKKRIGAHAVGAFMSDSVGYSPFITEGHKVKNILDKNKDRHTPAVVDIGTYMYTPDVFSRIDSLKPSERGETEIWDLNRSYINDGTYTYSAIDSWWIDAGGSLDLYEEANEHFS